MGFATMFASGLALLAVLVAAAVVLPSPWSWAIGLAWITYDTWLLAHHLGRGVRAIRAAAPTLSVVDGPALTVLIAAHDEAATIVGTLASLAPGPRDEVIVIDDGSTDGTAEVAAAAGVPVMVLRQERGGKARALNRGLAVARGEVVVTVDADTRLEPGALAALRAAFSADPGLTAACGILVPTCRGGLQARAFALFQAREYARAFLWRAGWAADGMLVLVSGAFAAYRREALIAAGSFDPASLVEDYEIMYRLHHHQPGTRAVVVPTARGTTDAPATLPAFLRQRRRWFGGFLATLWRYRAMVGEARHGALGRWHLRLKTIDTVLPMYGFLALAALAWIWWRDGQPHVLVLAVLGAKLLVDLALHLRAERVYRRWLGQPAPGAWALPATLAEQIVFQPLRQLGAICGWWVWLRRAAQGGVW